jgi:Arc/MetJ-type ribon-helix-helix transcriptional regulator
MDADDNGRITLRLEKENLRLIDAFLEQNPQFRNRSQLARDAVQTFIENVTQGGNTVALKVPVKVLEVIDHLVSEGYFNDRQDAVVQALREHYDAARIKGYVEHKTELQKAKGERVELKMGDRDEVVSK